MIYPTTGHDKYGTKSIIQQFRLEETFASHLVQLLPQSTANFKVTCSFEIQTDLFLLDPLTEHLQDDLALSSLLQLLFSHSPASLPPRGLHIAILQSQ